MLKLLIASLIVYYTDVYTLAYTPIDGSNSVSLDIYHGKKILLVNIATGSGYVNQLGELQQLHQQHGDSLIIIAFPSNSFNHEGRSNSEIRQFCQSNYNTTFVLAQKTSVKGLDIHPVFNWLNRKTENNMLESEVLGDFQKYLINSDGKLIGEFSPVVSPLSSEIQNAIASN